MCGCGKGITTLPSPYNCNRGCAADCRLLCRWGIAVLQREETIAAEVAIAASEGNDYDLHSLSPYNAASVMERAIEKLAEYQVG